MDGGAGRSCWLQRLEDSVDRKNTHLSDFSVAQYHDNFRAVGFGDGQYLSPGGVVWNTFYLPLVCVVGIKGDVVRTDFAGALCEDGSAGEQGDDEGEKLNLLFHCVVEI